MRQGILDEFTQALDRELDLVYATVKQAQGRPSTRRYLDRDATRLVLREYLGLSDPEIADYEGEEFSYKDEETRLHKNIDASIRNLAKDAGLTLRPRPLGRRPIDDPIYRDYLA